MITIDLERVCAVLYLHFAIGNISGFVEKLDDGSLKYTRQLRIYKDDDLTSASKDFKSPSQVLAVQSVADARAIEEARLASFPEFLREDMQPALEVWERGVNEKPEQFLERLKRETDWFNALPAETVH